MLFLAFFVVVLLGFLIPGILIATIDGNVSLNFFLMYLLVIWCPIRLAFTALKGRRRLTLMLFYVFIYVFMGVQPLLSIWSNAFPHPEIMFSEDMITYCIFLVILGIIGFESGYYRFRKSEIYVRKPKFSGGIVTPISISMLWIGNIVVTFLFAFALTRYGPNVFLGLRDGGFTISEFQGPDTSATENQLVIFGLRGLAATLLFITLYLWKIRKEVCLSVWKLRTALIYLLILNLLISNPLNAPRLWSGAIVLTSLFISLRWRGTRSFMTWSTAGCLGMLLLFSGTDPRLIFSKQLIKGGEITLANTFKELSLSIQNLPGDYNFDAFQMVFYTTVYTEKMGYSWGNQLLLPAFFWVPRSLWPSKPLGTPDIVASFADFPSLNVSSPLWSEGYVNFGLFGVILFMFVFGTFARLSDNILSYNNQRSAFQMIIACFFASNTFILLRGDLTSGTMYLQMIMVFTFLFLIVFKRRLNKSSDELSHSGL